MTKKLSNKKRSIVVGFESRRIETLIEELLKYMDFHLYLLTMTDNQQEITIQKSQLNKIRKKLFDLEYFSYETT